MNGVAVTTEVLTLDDGTQYSNVYIEKVTDVLVDPPVPEHGQQIRYLNREGATVVTKENTLDLCRRAKTRRAYAVDVAQKRNWQTLLEELREHANRGPVQLWCWWKAKQALIQQSLAELEALEREGE
jgi:hypothetical protein